MNETPVQERRVRIANRMGMHARPAAAFVKLAGRFKSEIVLARDGLEVNGKSIMGVLMLAAEQGAELTIRGEGPDSEEALEALGDLVEDGFGEAGEEP
ncbi:MAG: HPr family phosphocarrier protein [Gemmatimonadales bacterium]|nr:MAG: HPr family phosphocarrier protein [Gemmatimonadales bacterium]